jgi:hypothetical protein
VLLYIYVHMGSSQSVHINICTDNNMISSSRYKCCQLCHMLEGNATADIQREVMNTTNPNSHLSSGQSPTIQCWIF